MNRDEKVLEFKVLDIIEFKDKESNDRHRGVYRIDKFCKSKDSALGWIDSVIYTDIKTGETYVKSKSEFASQFKKRES